MNKYSASLSIALLVASVCTPLSAVLVPVVNDSYIREGSPDSNYNGEDRYLIGGHGSSSLLRMRTVLEFDLSSFAGQTVTSVSLSMIDRAAAFGSDFAQGSYDILLLPLGESFDETTVSWISLTPAGGDVSGTVLSTLAAYTPGAGGDTRTFASSAAFISEVQSAIDGDGLLSLIAYSPGAESNFGPSTVDNSFYRFDAGATLDVVAIPEPATFALIFGGLAFAFVVRRQYRR